MMNAAVRMWSLFKVTELAVTLWVALRSTTIIKFISSHETIVRRFLTASIPAEAVLQIGKLCLNSIETSKEFKYFTTIKKLFTSW